MIRYYQLEAAAGHLILIDNNILLPLFNDYFTWKVSAAV